MILHGNCLDHMRTFPDHHFDAVVTDPPYGMKFMRQKWDYDVPSIDVWYECLRILKPGGYLLAFGGTRTYHRLVTRIEDAGFIIHPMLAWIFGTGFPKATKVDLAEWAGWRYGGQTLKPAMEPICMAQRPMSERTGTANISRWGVGAVNIDACRVETNGEVLDTPIGKGVFPARHYADQQREARKTAKQHALGRWPANVILDGSDEVLSEFPYAPGQRAPISDTAPSSKMSVVYGRMKREGQGSANAQNQGTVGFKMRPGDRRLDTGSAARFFYCAKPTKAERDLGCEHLPDQVFGRSGAAAAAAAAGEHYDKDGGFNKTRVVKNNHTTVKPIALMRWMLRFVAAPGGRVLDPYCGSGTTVCAGIIEGIDVIGIESEEWFVRMAEARSKAVQPGLALIETEAEAETQPIASEAPTLGEQLMLHGMET